MARARLTPACSTSRIWKARSRTFQDLALYREGGAAIALDGEPEWMDAAWVYGDFFKLFGRSPALGLALDDGKDARAVVLNHRLWRSRFGASQDVIGRTVNLNGMAFRVAGVMPEDFNFPSDKTQLCAPAAAWPDWQHRRGHRDGGFGAVVGRMRPGVTPTEARAEMETINRQLAA